MPLLTSSPLTLLITFVLAYLMGAIPFGVLVTRALGLGDLRRIGSGNIGATNVLRTGNKGAALATLLLDGGKGTAAVLIAWAVTGAWDATQLAALAAFLGHLYPVWLRFRGGKGVATFLGLLLGLSWPVGVAACATWLVGAVLTRMSSAAALIAAALTPIWLLLFGQLHMAVLVILLTALIYLRHAANLGRIKAGTEPRIGQKK